MKNNSPHISVVSPVYGCKTCLYELYSRLKDSLEKINPDFEIILINDASPDDVWSTIVEISAKDNRVKGINFSRNFGQHYAITAGLDYCTGQWVVVMDCDLQDQPEEIIKLYNKANEGFDYVQASRFQRKDSIIKKFFSNLFYKILEYLTESKIDGSIANFGIYSKEVILAINQLREKIRWFPTFVNWVGFKGTVIEVIHAKRQLGKSSYSFSRLVRLSFDVLLLNSNKPLRLIIKFGLYISFFSFAYAISILIRYLMGNISVLGWSSLIMSIWFLSGVIIFIIGVVGLYISKIFDHIKDRPIYLIKNKTF